MAASFAGGMFAAGFLASPVDYDGPGRAADDRVTMLANLAEAELDASVKPAATTVALPQSRRPVEWLGAVPAGGRDPATEGGSARAADDPAADLLARGEVQVAAGRLTDPAGDNALETYRQIQAVDGDGAAAHRLLRLVRSALEASGRDAITARKWDEARRFYELALHLEPDSRAQEPGGPAKPGAGSSTEPSAGGRTTLPAPARPPLPDAGVAQLSAETIAMLVKRGDALLAIGDITAARLMYERAASGGSAKALTGLGKTHDPAIFEQAGVRGIQPDPIAAAEWYRRAAAAGDAEAADRLRRLEAFTRNDPRPGLSQ